MKNGIIYLLNLPLYWISLLIPKKKNVWVFGSWFGDKYADNSKYLFEYVSDNHKEIKAYWLTNDNDIIEEVKAKGYRVLKTYSIKGYFISAFADKCFVSTGMHDVNRFTSSMKNKIQLWHGTPLKKILNDVNSNHLLKNTKKKSIIPFNNSHYKLLTSPSETVSETFKTAFTNVDNIVITGFPRNDIFKNSDLSENLITFLPTHRGEGNGGIQNIFKTFDAEEINKKLKEINHKLIIKPHFYDAKNINNLDSYSNIILDNGSSDTYELLTRTKILITDYSSIYFDFLLTQRPIIFTPFDIENYLTKDREMYYNYNDVTPGKKCYNWTEVLSEVININKGLDAYSNERKLINNKFNKYQDYKFSERVYSHIQKEC